MLGVLPSIALSSLGIGEDATGDITREAAAPAHLRRPVSVWSGCRLAITTSLCTCP